jgi:MFS family permease
MSSTSTWFALRNPAFCRVWLASLLAGTVVSTQDMTATWLMHDLDSSPLSLSLMATASSAPFFLFTLPAGAIADIVNRRLVIVSAVLWREHASRSPFGAWTRLVSARSLLACVFALGIGLALGAPVWGAIVPDIVGKDELPSAVTLGGVQINLSGIVGPSLGGFLLPLLQAPLLISLNALAFVVVALVILPSSPRKKHPTELRENLTESFISSLRYARNSRRMKIILFRNILFSLLSRSSPRSARDCAQRNGLFGYPTRPYLYERGGRSLAGALIALPYLRRRIPRMQSLRSRWR